MIQTLQKEVESASVGVEREENKHDGVIGRRFSSISEPIQPLKPLSSINQRKLRYCFDPDLVFNMSSLYRHTFHQTIKVYNLLW